MDYPTFSSDDFNWKSGKGRSDVTTLGISALPKDGFYLRSERTGTTLLFLYDDVTMVENEFFDGEGMAFVSSRNVTVQIWF